MNKTDWPPQPKLIIILFILVIIIELITPIESLFSYLYILPLLLVNPHGQKSARLKLSIFASILTIFNLFILGKNHISIITISNRIIVAIALIITGILSDRTHYLEKKIAEQEAQLNLEKQINQMRADFVSTLTHDLKTPLLGAIETIKALRKGKFGQIILAQDKVLEIMMRSHQTSLNLVMTMLDIYRNDSEGLLLECQPVNLVNLATESMTMLIEFASTRQVYLSLNYGDSDFRRFFWVNGDTLELQRVFINLLTNSINHSPRGGKVEIIMESQRDYHIVKISDMGAGIDNEDLPNLFERFYQGYSNRKGKGSGLGLYLSRQIIQAHHGIIWAENLAPTGAVFNFRLPAFPPPDNLT